MKESLDREAVERLVKVTRQLLSERQPFVMHRCSDEQPNPCGVTTLA